MSTSAVSDALKSIEAQWNAAGAGWSPDRFTTLFTDDALFFGGRAELYVGRGIRDYFASYVGQIKGASCQLVEQRTIEIAPNTHLAQGYVNFSTLLADGKEFNVKMRTTLLIAKEGTEWKVRAHHFSPVPEHTPIPD